MMKFAFLLVCLLAVASGHDAHARAGLPGADQAIAASPPVAATAEDSARSRPSDRQRDAFSTATCATVLVDQSYFMVFDVSMPFREVLADLFRKYAGIRVVSDTTRSDCLLIVVDAYGSATKKDYQSMGVLTQREPLELYTGAGLSGSLSAGFSETDAFSVSFSGTALPPLFGEVDTARSKTPNGAPFGKAFRAEGGFYTAVLNLIGQMKGAEAVTSALEDRDSTIRDNALAALWRLKDPAALQSLAAQMSSEDLSFRQEVARTIGSIGGDRAIDILIDGLSNDDRKVQSICGQRLHRLTGQDFGTDQGHWREWRASQTPATDSIDASGTEQP